MKTQTNEEPVIRMSEITAGQRCGTCATSLPESSGPTLCAGAAPLCDECGRKQAPVLVALLKLGDQAKPRKAAQSKLRQHYTELAVASAFLLHHPQLPEKHKKNTLSPLFRYLAGLAQAFTEDLRDQHPPFPPDSDLLTAYLATGEMLATLLAAPELPVPVYNELSEWASEYELIFAPAETEQRAATRLRALTNAYATASG